MPGLRDLQNQFVAGVLDPGQQAIHTSLRGNGLAREQRLQIYRNNIFSNLTDALAATHPVVKKLVGEGFFRYASHEFILQHPSPSGDLEDFGVEFSRFLSRFPPAGELSYLPDVARLEWLYHEVYHAAESEPLDMARLSSVAPSEQERLCFTLHTATRLVRSRYPILKIWQVNQDDFEGDERVSLDAGGENLLLRRHEVVEIHSLDAAEFEFLRLLHDGATLGQATEAAVSLQADFDLLAVLVRFVGDHTLTEFQVNN